jgi:hypothetical protein
LTPFPQLCVQCGSQVSSSRALPVIGKRSRVRGMTIDLTEQEAALLLKELNGIINEDRYFLSQRIKTLKAIRAKIRPEPAREPPPPPPNRYAPPRASATTRRRGAANKPGPSIGLRANENEDDPIARRSPLAPKTSALL